MPLESSDSASASAAGNPAGKPHREPPSSGRFEWTIGRPPLVFEPGARNQEERESRSTKPGLFAGGRRLGQDCRGSALWFENGIGSRLIPALFRRPRRPPSAPASDCAPRRIKRGAVWRTLVPPRRRRAAACRMDLRVAVRDFFDESDSVHPGETLGSAGGDPLSAQLTRFSAMSWVIFSRSGISGLYRMGL